MSLINDALKEAKAQSGHSALPPDLAEKVNGGQGGKPGPNKPGSGRKRRGGAGDLAIFAVIFIVLIGGILVAGYFMFPELARKVGLAQAEKPAGEPDGDEPTGVPDEEDTDDDTQTAPETVADDTADTAAIVHTTPPDAADEVEDPPRKPAPQTNESVPPPEEDAGTTPPVPPDVDGGPETIETVPTPAQPVVHETLKPKKPQPAPPEMRERFHLSAIVGTASRRMAVINGGIVQPGDTVNDITIVAISRRQLIVEKDGAQYILRPSTNQ